MAINKDPIAEVEAMRVGLARENHRTRLMTLGTTGRHVIFSYPADLSDEEIMDFAAWVFVGLRQTLPPGIHVPVLHPVRGGART